VRQVCASRTDIGSGKISSSPFPNPSKIAVANAAGEAFGMSRPAFSGERQHVDDRSAGAGQHRKARLREVVVGVEVDGEVLLERRALAEVVVDRHAGVVDQHVERRDALDGGPDLLGVGDVQDERGDALVGMVQGLPGPGVDPPRASAQGLFDECLPDAAVRARQPPPLRWARARTAP
jgi:hypothetical protein